MDGDIRARVGDREGFIRHTLAAVACLRVRFDAFGDEQRTENAGSPA